MLPSVESRPCDSSGVLALEEEGFGLAVLEAEDFAVAADVEFSLTMEDGSVAQFKILVGLVKVWMRCVLILGRKES